MVNPTAMIELKLIFTWNQMKKGEKFKMDKLHKLTYTQRKVKIMIRSSLKVVTIVNLFYSNLYV